jgi:hypothetical protein
MGDLLKLIWCFVIGLFRSRAALEAEIVALRHQLNVLRRKAPKRLVFGNFDRFVFASLYRIAPGILNALVIVKPQTVIRWHRAGFRLFWRWKSRPRVGRPKVPLEVRQPNRDMSLANPLWGAPRSTANCSSSVSMWVRPRSRNIWQDTGDLHRRDGGRFCATTPRIADALSKTGWIRLQKFGNR